MGPNFEPKNFKQKLVQKSVKEFTKMQKHAKHTKMRGNINREGKYGIFCVGRF